MTSLLILTIGIPGSGKTTWVKNFSKDHGAFCVISTDELRKEMTGSYDCDPKQNPMIHGEALKRAGEFLRQGKDVIIDSTNVDVQDWLKYKQLRPLVMAAKVFDITPGEAYYRIQRRERKVPLNIIEDKWKTFQQSKKYLTSVFNLIY